MHMCVFLFSLLSIIFFTSRRPARPLCFLFSHCYSPPYLLQQGKNKISCKHEINYESFLQAATPVVNYTAENDENKSNKSRQIHKSEAIVLQKYSIVISLESSETTVIPHVFDRFNNLMLAARKDNLAYIVWRKLNAEDTVVAELPLFEY